MKNKGILFSLFSLVLASCVTESKPVEETKPYVATVPPQQVLAKSGVASAVPKSKSDSIAGHLVVKCRILNNTSAKLQLCGETTVKLVNELSKDVSEHNFKGDRVVIPVPYNGSYSIEISTKSCSLTRKFSGMTSGMGLTAQFENCSARQ